MVQREEGRIVERLSIEYVDMNLFTFGDVYIN